MHLGPTHSEEPGFDPQQPDSRAHLLALPVLSLKWALVKEHGSYIVHLIQFQLR